MPEVNRKRHGLFPPYFTEKMGETSASSSSSYDGEDELPKSALKTPGRPKKEANVHWPPDPVAQYLEESDSSEDDSSEIESPIQVRTPVVTISKLPPYE